MKIFSFLILFCIFSPLSFSARTKPIPRDDWGLEFISYTHANGDKYLEIQDCEGFPLLDEQNKPLELQVNPAHTFNGLASFLHSSYQRTVDYFQFQGTSERYFVSEPNSVYELMNHNLENNNHSKFIVHFLDGEFPMISANESIKSAGRFEQAQDKNYRKIKLLRCGNPFQFQPNYPNLYVWINNTVTLNSLQTFLKQYFPVLRDRVISFHVDGAYDAGFDNQANTIWHLLAFDNEEDVKELIVNIGSLL